jgi:hypothetical protein
MKTLILAAMIGCTLQPHWLCNLNSTWFQGFSTEEQAEQYLIDHRKDGKAATCGAATTACGRRSRPDRHSTVRRRTLAQAGRRLFAPLRGRRDRQPRRGGRRALTRCDGAYLEIEAYEDPDSAQECLGRHRRALGAKPGGGKDVDDQGGGAPLASTLAPGRALQTLVGRTGPQEVALYHERPGTPFRYTANVRFAQTAAQARAMESAPVV